MSQLLGATVILNSCMFAVVLEADEKQQIKRVRLATERQHGR